MRFPVFLRNWFPAALGGIALLLSIGGTASAQTTATPVAAPTTPAARIWFYREFEPSVSLNVANVSLNGQLAAVVQPDGSATYRNVLPGHYHITVESVGQDINQSKDLDIGPGQEAYVKILASADWESGGDTYSYHRDTFYVSLVPPQVAQTELANRRYSGG
jgi:hypothetical protein